MKKIKILKRMVLILFSFTLLWFLGDNILTISALFFNNDVLHLGHFSYEKTSLPIKIVVIIKLFAFYLFLYGAYFLIKILLIKNITDYYNNNAFNFLNKAGKLIIISNIVAFLLSISIFFIDIKYYVYFNANSIYLSLLMIVFGLFLIIFSKVLVVGKKIKQENDLAI